MLKLYSNTGKEFIKEVSLVSDTIILMKSRRIAYEISFPSSNDDKFKSNTFLVYGKISGPKDEERGI